MKLRLLEQWNEFAHAAGLHDAPQVQRMEMRRAFYAGALYSMEMLSKAVSKGEAITDEDIQVLEDFRTELLRFSDEMRRGVA